MKQKINIAIIGASGYTASELIRILLTHPNINIKYLIGNKTVGQEIGESYPHLNQANLPPISKFSDIAWQDLDCVFLCMPHGESQNIINEIPDNVKIIDLSADFRIQDLDLYQKYYGKHNAPSIASKAVYGLSEIYADEIKQANIVACPGCYPTSILLPILPLLEKKLISDYIIADSKSGISGAGRSTKQGSLFCEINENIKPYGIATHRHLAEMIENINKISTAKIEFTPHIVPINRGIISTIYFETKNSASNLKKTLKEFYQGKEFIRILETDKLPNIRNVYGTNFCDINIFDTENENRKILISTIDNLTKGSSGQAVQNMNLMFNLAENSGLTNPTIFP